MKTENTAGFANKRQSGFSLIEVLIAVVILSVGIVGILQGMYSAVNVLDIAVDQTRASMLVRTRLSVVRQAALELRDLAEFTSAGDFEEPYEQYRWETKVDDVSLSAAADTQDAGGGGVLYQVAVAVWRVGSERKHEAATYMYVPLPQDAAAAGGLTSGGLEEDEQ